MRPITLRSASSAVIVRVAGLLSALVAILISVSIHGCGADNPVCPDCDIASLRYNEVMFKQIHNAYIERDGQKFAPCLDMVHGTIESQLTVDPAQPWKGGALGVELDIWTTGSTVVDGETKSIEWAVKHVGDFDDSNWPKFSAYLNRLLVWSNAHPNHPVITIKIEEKRYGRAVPWLNFIWSNYDAYTSWYGNSFKPGFATFLDGYLRTHFDVNRIYTPGMLQGKAPTLVAGARKGWPTMDALKGRFIFFVMGDDAAKTYAGNRPQDRLCFQRGGLDDENCVFTKAPDTGLAGTGGLRENARGFTDALREARSRHPEKIFAAYLGKHLSDGACNLLEGPDEDHLDWTGAIGAGVNIIQTDIVNSAYAMVGPEGYWPIPKETRWSDHGVTREARPTSAPSAIEYKNTLYVIFDNNYQPKMVRAPFLDYFLWGYESVGGGESCDRPALAVYKDKLWMFSLNKGRSSLMSRTYDGTTWSTSVALTTASIGPGAAVFKGKLYVFYANSAKEIMWMNFDGSQWSTPARAIGKTANEPAACVHNGKLKIVYRASTSNNIYMAYYDGSAWSDEINISGINGALTNKAPTVAVNGDRLEVAIKGQSSEACLYTFSVYGDRDISSQSYVYDRYNAQETTSAPGLLCVDGTIAIFYRTLENNYLYFMQRE